MPLYLPGTNGSQPVQVQVVDGMAIHQGDILLGHVSQLALRFGRPRTARAPNGISYATAVSSNDDLWPGGVIPYVIDSSLSGADNPKLMGVIDRLNQTALTFRPATAADPDRVRFVNHGKGCYSFYGRVGGAQDVHVGGCNSAAMMHEILHAAGFYHEHARPDRDQWVDVVWSEVADGEQSNFQLQKGARTFGGYDFGSIMHYSAYSFSKSGNKTLVAKVPGVKVGEAVDLSPKDVAGIAELYGGAPPVTTPPPPGTTPPPPPATNLPTWADLLGLPPNPQGLPAWPALPGLPLQGLPAGLPPWPILSTTPVPQGMPPIPHVFW